MSSDIVIGRILARQAIEPPKPDPAVASVIGILQTAQRVQGEASNTIEAITVSGRFRTVSLEPTSSSVTAEGVEGGFSQEGLEAAVFAPADEEAIAEPGRMESLPMTHCGVRITGHAGQVFSQAGFAQRYSGGAWSKVAFGERDTFVSQGQYVRAAEIKTVLRERASEATFIIDVPSETLVPEEQILYFKNRNPTTLTCTGIMGFRNRSLTGSANGQIVVTKFGSGIESAIFSTTTSIKVNLLGIVSYGTVIQNEEDEPMKRLYFRCQVTGKFDYRATNREEWQIRAMLDFNIVVNVDKVIVGGATQVFGADNIGRLRHREQMMAVMVNIDNGWKAISANTSAVASIVDYLKRGYVGGAAEPSSDEGWWKRFTAKASIALSAFFSFAEKASEKLGGEEAAEFTYAMKVGHELSHDAGEIAASAFEEYDKQMGVAPAQSAGSPSAGVSTAGAPGSPVGTDILLKLAERSMSRALTVAAQNDTALRAVRAFRNYYGALSSHAAAGLAGHPLYVAQMYGTYDTEGDSEYKDINLRWAGYVVEGETTVVREYVFTLSGDSKITTTTSVRPISDHPSSDDLRSQWQPNHEAVSSIQTVMSALPPQLVSTIHDTAKTVGRVFQTAEAAAQKFPLWVQARALFDMLSGSESLMPSIVTAKFAQWTRKAEI